MVLARVLDDKMAGLYRAGKIHGGVFLGRGQEALSVSVGLALREGDIFAPLIRDVAGRLAFGEPVLDAVRTYLGSALGPMRGRDGNVHRGRPKEGLLAMISHLGAMISVVNGASRLHSGRPARGRRRRVLRVGAGRRKWPACQAETSINTWRPRRGPYGELLLPGAKVRYRDDTSTWIGNAGALNFTSTVGWPPDGGFDEARR